MPGYVLDLEKFHATGSWSAAVSPADRNKYPLSLIGKTWFPPLTARLNNMRALPVTGQQFAALLELSPALPTHFNWADNTNTPKKAKINSVQNQGQCGSCWAVSSASAIGDQWAVATGKAAVMLSPFGICKCACNQWNKSGTAAAASCTSKCDGDQCENCDNGGWPYDAGVTAATIGLVSNTCWPYDDSQCSLSSPPANQCTALTCPRWYVNPSSIRQGFVRKDGQTNVATTSIDQVDVPASLDLIRRHIYQFGPVVIGFQVPSDFENYTSGVWRSNVGDSVGGHAVVITGWGYDAQNKLYWVVRNSWGTGWGTGGYFRVYAYDSAYPKNNLGFDIPMFPQDSGASGAISGWGGAVLWNVDTQRSPKSTLSVSALTLSSDAKKDIFFALVGVIVVGTIVGWLLMRYNESDQR